VRLATRVYAESRRVKIAPREQSTICSATGSDATTTTRFRGPAKREQTVERVLLQRWQVVRVVPQRVFAEVTTSAAITVRSS
jgi:hypothetical protein